MDLRNPGNLHPIETLWAILSRDKNGNEGLVAINTMIGPQVAITSSKVVLDIYLKEVTAKEAKKEAAGFCMEMVLTEFRRFRTEDKIL